MALHGHEHTHEHGHPHTHAHDHGHDAQPHPHVHDPEEQRAVVNRLSRLIGHLESVKRMVEDDRDCSEVLIQLSAVRAALNSTGRVILKNHITHCITDAVRTNDTERIDELNEAIDKFIR